MAVGVSGLSSDIDTQDLINKLVEVEKKPLARMQEEKEILNLKVEVLDELNKNLSILKESSYKLYGLESVFRGKKAFGVNEDFFTAVANPNAIPGNIKLEIIQLAASHSVASAPFPTTTEFKKGTFLIRVGTNEKSIEFDGGSGEQLIWSINKQAGDLVDAGIIQDTADSSVLSLSGKATGKDNYIDLKDPDGIFSTIPLLKKKKNSSFDLDLSTFNISSLEPYEGYKTSLKTLAGNAFIDQSSLILDNSAREMTIEETKADINTVMQVTWLMRTKTRKIEEKKEIQNNTDSESLFSRIFSVKVKEIEIKGAPFALNVPEAEPENSTEKKPVPKEKESGIGIAMKSGTKRIEKLFPLESTTTEKTVEIPLDKGFDSFNSIIFYSEDDNSELVLKKVSIINKSKGGMEFAQTFQEPKNSLFKVNDIDVERSKNNNIEDVLKNISLSLKQVTEKPLSFHVDYDKEKIENNVTQFVTNYNKCLNMMMDLQKSKEVTKPGDYDRSERGLLAGDITINNIRSRMRAIMIAPYPTSISNRLVLPMQLGISTGKVNTPIDEVRSGFLKFDKELFRKIFERYPQATAELFGSDTDGNKIIDNGVGYTMYDFLMNVTRPKSGMVNLMVDKIKTDIDSKKKQIKTKEDQIASYEEKLKVQFLNMEKNMSGLKAQQKWMDQQMNNKNKD